MPLSSMKRRSDALRRDDAALRPDGDAVAQVSQSAGDAEDGVCLMATICGQSGRVAYDQDQRVLLRKYNIISCANTTSVKRSEERAFRPLDRSEQFANNAYELLMGRGSS